MAELGEEQTVPLADQTDTPSATKPELTAAWPATLDGHHDS